MEKILYKIFYLLKPAIPRNIQILIRSFLVKLIAKKYESTWPILKKASVKPQGWKGWPENKKFAVILTHDVEHSKGYENVLKLMNIEKDLGFVSSFNFVPERDYQVKKELLDELKKNGFEYGVHGLYHDGKLFSSEAEFLKRAEKINKYLKDWGAVGFRAPSMHHNLDLIGALDIHYDLSTFDTDPFEPQPDGVGTIFPYWIENKRNKNGGYVEMPYTLPQDFTPFILMRENSIRIWKEKLQWIVENNGMVLINVHPDYIHFAGTAKGVEEYPEKLYSDFLNYILKNYRNQYWNPLPYEAADYIKKSKSLFPSSSEDEVVISTTESKRICIVVQSDFINDPRVRRQANALADIGYSLDVISLGNRDQPRVETINNIEIRRILRFFPKNNILVYLTFSTIFFIKAFLILNILFIKRKYSLVQVHNMPDHLVFVALLPRILGIPVVLDIHDLTIELFKEKWSKLLFQFMYPFLRTFECLAYKFSSHLITVTQQCKDILSKRGVSQDKMTLILNTADENQFPFFEGRKFKKLTEKVNLFYHGTLARRFGLHLIIESFPKILSELPGSQLFLYGVGDNDYIIYLEKMIKKLSLQDSIHIPGLIKYDEIIDYIKEMDIGVVPYLDTPYMNLALSTKTFEYVSCGLPVCASRLAATQTVFRESSICYFDPNNIEDISEKIISLVKNPDNQLKQVKSAIEDLQRISGSEMKKRYLKMIHKLLEPTALPYKLL